jgi:hypothetical protein
VTATAEGVEPFHILRTYSHRKELGRSKVLTAIFRNGHYDRLREPVFLFDGNADCISQGDFISSAVGTIFRKYSNTSRSSRRRAEVPWRC